MYARDERLDVYVFLERPNSVLNASKSGYGRLAFDVLLAKPGKRGR